MGSLRTRIERLERQRQVEVLVIILKDFSGGDLTGYTGVGGSAGRVRRLATESEESLLDRATKAICNAPWGGMVICETR